MTAADNAGTQGLLVWSATRESPGFWPVLLVLVTAAVYISPLFYPFDLLDPDEGIHAVISQEMLESGDYLVARFRGKPFFDKPILFFWAQALSLRIFGMNEVGVRLPGLLLGWLGGLTTGLIAARLYGRTAGWYAGLMALTAVLPLILAQAAVHDVAMVPLTNLAIISLWEATQTCHARRAISLTLGGGLCLGLAVLTKGLIGVAVVGVTLAVTLLILRQISLRIAVVAGGSLAVAALVALPWYLLVECANPGFLHYYFVERHLFGYLTRTQTHGEHAWWYYLPALLAGTLPWSPNLPVAAMELIGRWRGGRPVEGRDLLPWVWLIGGTLFLSCAGSKLVTYLCPVFPAVSVIAGWLWAELQKQSVSRNSLRIISGNVWSGSLLLLPGLPLGVWTCTRLWSETVSGLWIYPAVGLSLFVLIPLAGWLWRGPGATFAGTLLVISVSFLAILAGPMREIPRLFSGRDLATWLNSRGTFPQPSLLFEESTGSVVFYLSPSMRQSWRQTGMVEAKDNEQRDWNDLPVGTAVFVPECETRHFLSHIDPLNFQRFGAGRWSVYQRLPRDAARVRVSH